jgi:aspartate/methionine/tyrosine aminotransferase
MPTGAKADPKTYLDLIDFAEDRNLLLVNDNPYSLIATGAPESILKYTTDKKHVLELNSLSKSHNMAGWRVGCLLGSAENIQHVLRIKSNLDSGMFKPVQEAAAVALRAEEEWYEELNKKYARRKEMVFKICDMLGCTYKTNSSGLFVWAKIPKAFNNDREFADYLLHEKHVFIAPGSIFGENGKNYIRISLCQPVEKIVEIINRLKIN